MYFKGNKGNKGWVKCHNKKLSFNNNKFDQGGEQMVINPNFSTELTIAPNLTIKYYSETTRVNISIYLIIILTIILLYNTRIYPSPSIPTPPHPPYRFYESIFFTKNCMLFCLLYPTIIGNKQMNE
jgi:hypothetical protein